MSRVPGLNPHDDIVNFLHEQEQLALSAPEKIIHEYVVQTRPENITIGEGSRIDSFVKLEGGIELTIGRCVHIASFAHIGIGGGVVRIKSFAAVASGGKVIGGSNQLDAVSMSACAPAHLQRVEPSVTRLREYSCVLTNATVLPGVELGTGAVLAANSVATKDIPAWEIWAGVPARFLKKRTVR